MNLFGISRMLGQLEFSAKRLALAGTIGALILISACSEQTKPSQPVEPTASTACSLDGMLLMDYPGPTGQIQYDQGPPDFFCNTVEMFAIYLKPEQHKRVVAVFTQDMGKADWNKPQGYWIDARTAFYVIGSKKTGSMGPTIGSFARDEDAQAFAKRNGGKVLRFDQVTFDMVSMDGGVLKDEKM